MPIREIAVAYEGEVVLLVDGSAATVSRSAEPRNASDPERFAEGRGAPQIRNGQIDEGSNCALQAFRNGPIRSWHRYSPRLPEGVDPHGRWRLASS